MTEFDSLFGSVWRGEAPAEALADWVRECHMDDPTRILHTTYTFTDPTPDLTNKAWLTVFREGGEATTAVFYVPDIELYQSCVFRDEELGAKFPTWLTEQIEFLYYVLSK